MTRLHPTVALQPDESVTSWVSRLAWVNHRSMGDFCRDLGLHFQGIVDGHRPALAQLASVVERAPEDLIASACVKQTDQTWTWRGERLHRRRHNMRICVECLRDDLNKGGDAAMHGRTLWTLPPMRTCCIHSVELQDVAGRDGLSVIHDFARQLDPHRMIIRDLPIMTRTPSGMELYLADRLAGHHGNNPWLNGLDWCVVAKTSEMIGRAIQCERNGSLWSHQEDVWYQAGALGFDVLKGGATSIRAHLMKLQRNYVSQTSRASSPTSVFGNLYVWVASRAKDAAYEPIRSCLASVMKEMFPFGEGDRIFGDLVERRTIHSIWTASREAETHPKRLRKLLANEGLIPACTEGLTDHQVRFDAEAARPLLDRVRQAVSASDAWTYLNAGRVQTKVLTDAGFIRPFASPAIAGVGALAYFRIDLDLFMETLTARAVPIADVAPSQGNIPSAAKRACCSSATIVAAILDRRLDWVGALKGVQGFMSVIVDVEQVRSSMARAPLDGVTRRGVEKRLHTNKRVVEALCMKGVLPAVSKAHPVNQCLVRVIDDSDLKAFELEYVLASALARDFGIHINTVRRCLLEKGISPVFDRSEFFVDIYRRSELKD